METTTLAGGCFWCTQAIFERLRGVSKVLAGYAGGVLDNPTYEDVSSGNTGHAEAIQVTFDTKSISLERILEVFWKLHDPTTPNQQGVDIGPQYRSAIFYHDEKQKEIAENSKLKAQKLYTNPIVTEIVAFEKFYNAEKYHQEYYNNNQNAAYCKLVIDPKIKKLYKNFGSLV